MNMPQKAESAKGQGFCAPVLFVFLMDYKMVRQGVLQREAGETERYFCAAVNREISEHE